MEVRCAGDCVWEKVVGGSQHAFGAAKVASGGAIVNLRAILRAT